jgi:predicted transglutaminase-like cysteine proteinase
MRSFGSSVFLACILFSATAIAHERSAHLLGVPSPKQRAALTELVQSTGSVVGPVTSVPSGWIDLCQRYIGECATHRLPAVDLNLTTNNLRILDHVNRWVNDAIEPISAMDHWGVINQWDYPVDGKGDCNSYALLKRKLLMEQGFPRQALLMTVVRDLHGDGHMILTVKTNKGDFVLDNLVDDIRAWNDTGYKYIKRQAQEDPNVWVELNDPLPQFETRLR